MTTELRMKRFDPALASAVGARVKARRKAMGLSQLRLAAIIGCTNEQVYHIEKGLSVPGSIIVIELAKALGMSPNEILGWEEP